MSSLIEVSIKLLTYCKWDCKYLKDINFINFGLASWLLSYEDYQTVTIIILMTYNLSTLSKEKKVLQRSTTPHSCISFQLFVDVNVSVSFAVHATYDERLTSHGACGLGIPMPLICFLRTGQTSLLFSRHERESHPFLVTGSTPCSTRALRGDLQIHTKIETKMLDNKFQQDLSITLKLKWISWSHLSAEGIFSQTHVLSSFLFFDLQHLHQKMWTLMHSRTIDQSGGQFFAHFHVNMNCAQERSILYILTGLQLYKLWSQSMLRPRVSLTHSKWTINYRIEQIRPLQSKIHLHQKMWTVMLYSLTLSSLPMIFMSTWIVLRKEAKCIS